MRCVPALPFTVAKARSWRSAIDDDPVYQRASDSWDLYQRQRFIDSLLAGYDVPKIYLHDLRGIHPTKVYAVVDGRQRLTAIWDYLSDRFTLGSPVPAEAGPDGRPSGAVAFSGLSPGWQRQLLQTHLSVVLIQEADATDIDDLFERLNSGSPLSPSDRRNALGGAMAGLIRSLAERAELARLMGLGSRSDRLEFAARFTWTAMTKIHGGASDLYPDSSMLDAMVRDGRTFTDAELEAIRVGVEALLAAPALPRAVQVWSVQRSNVTG